jgi:hypothetical protein
MGPASSSAFSNLSLSSLRTSALFPWRNANHIEKPSRSIVIVPTLMPMPALASVKIDFRWSFVGIRLGIIRSMFGLVFSLEIVAVEDIDVDANTSDVKAKSVGRLD